MNFPPFGVGVPLTAALPVATQYTAAGKITQSVTTPNGQVVGVLQGGENGVHYIRPLDANTFAAVTSVGQQVQQQQNNVQTTQAQTLITLPVTMPGAKPGDPQQHVQIQVIPQHAIQTPQIATTQNNSGQSPKYHISQIPIQTFGQGTTVLTVAYNPNQEGIQILDGQNGIAEGMTVVAAIQPQDLQLIQTDPNDPKSDKEITPVALIKSEYNKDDEQQQQQHHQQQQHDVGNTSITTIPAQYLQNTNIQEYLQKMQQATAAALPITNLQQFLKFNNTEIKREQNDEQNNMLETINISTEDGEQLILNDVSTEQNLENMEQDNDQQQQQQQQSTSDEQDKNKKKKKYKKKPPKPKKPKPGQVHIATALDGTTLFCCPECHMAYPEKELLEQHLVGHKIERRFICDICGAGLKRKEHLERHKLGHNPDRPFICSICMKGFKRKEHLNLHFVIHSGEKTEICGECGKGFYRKDHLRKHSRSHITRRAKEQAERQNILIKEANNGVVNAATTSAQVTIQVPNSQMQIPVQIQVPQHHIQVTTNTEDEANQVSTVVLPTASESITIIPN